jgi:hypothetical protein
MGLFELFPRCRAGLAAGAAWLALAAAANAQSSYCPQPFVPQPYCPPALPAPVTPPTTTPPTTPSTTPTTPSTTPSTTEAANQPSPTQEPTLSPERFGAVGGENVALATPNMMGDFLLPSGSCRTVIRTTSTPITLGPNQTFSPAPTPSNPNAGYLITTAPGVGLGRPPVIVSQVFLPNGLVQISSTSSVVCVPSSTHTFKIADNNNAMVQDRVFCDYSFYGDVNRGFNRANGITGTSDVHQELFGFEKTFLDGNASFGLSMPLDTLVDNTAGGTGTNTDVGNLTLTFKYLLAMDRATGDAVCAGLAATFPTGPRGFAGVPGVVGFSDTTLQPYVGANVRSGAFYAVAFSAIDIATDSNDVTLWYNDLGVGYLVYENRGGEGFITGLAPTLELHVNTPLSHRGLSSTDPAGTPDWVDITSGLTVGFGGRSSLALGVNVPVTGPLPYSIEALAQLNLRF